MEEENVASEAAEQRDFRNPLPNGVKRPIQFVPARSEDEVVGSSTKVKSSLRGESYLALVLPSVPSSSSSSSPSLAAAEAAAAAEGADQSSATPESLICKVCGLPVSQDDDKTRHETTIAHQVCLEHSHPPSAIDRTRKGFSYLQAYGWDPDSRTGLGARNEGILHPIKPKEKKDHAGIGAKVLPSRSGEFPAKVQRLNVKQARKMEADDKKRKEKLQQLFYSNVDFERYLGPNA